MLFQTSLSLQNYEDLIDTLIAEMKLVITEKSEFENWDTAKTIAFSELSDYQNHEARILKKVISQISLRECFAFDLDFIGGNWEQVFGGQRVSICWLWLG